MRTRILAQCPFVVSWSVRAVLTALSERAGYRRQYVCLLMLLAVGQRPSADCNASCFGQTRRTRTEKIALVLAPWLRATYRIVRALPEKLIVAYAVV